jgi:hypothetical protein
MKKTDIGFFALLAALLAVFSAQAAFYPVNRGMINTVTRVTTSAATNEIAATANQVYIATGSSNETFDLPDAQNLPNDWWYLFINNSSGTVTVRNFGNSTIATVATGRAGNFYLKSNATQNGDWEYSVPANSGDLSNYYTKSEHISSSAGAADAGKPIVLDASGRIDSSMVAGGSGLGDVVGPSSSVDGEIVLFDATTGKLIKRATGTGYAKATSGVYSTQSVANSYIELYQSVASALGDIVYGGASGTPTRLAGNTTTTRNFLRQTGDGVNSAAPAWDTLVSGDIPNNAANTSGNAATATALAANPSDCASDRYAISSIANGDLTCAQVSLSAGVTGTLPVGNGGTGITSGTSGGIPYYSASNTIASSGALTQYQVVLGGGAGAAPNVVSGTGTSSQVLTSNGAGANPTWQDASGGGGAIFDGAARHPGVANCEWPYASSQNSFQTAGADGDCTTPAGSNLIGNVTAPGTKIPGFVLTVDDAYYYRITVNGPLTNGSSGISCFWRITDGTDSSNRSFTPSNQDMPNATHVFYIKPTSDGSKTYYIQGTGGSGSGGCAIQMQNTGHELTFYVERVEQI